MFFYRVFKEAIKKFAVKVDAQKGPLRFREEINNRFASYIMIHTRHLVF